MSRKVAIVTGSNKGIGYQTVKNLCSKVDGTVYLTARDTERGLKAVEALKKEGLNPAFHQLDVTDQASIDRLAAHIKKQHGGLDVLVNNAGILIFPDSGLSLGEIAEKTLETNYFGVRNLCKALYPLLRPHARVVNISSSAGHLSRIVGEELKKRFADPNLTEEGLDALAREYIQACKEGKQEERGWPTQGNAGYATSKVLISTLARIHQRQFLKDPREDLVINHVEPGYVDTDLVRHRGPLTLEEGSVSPTYAALLPPNITSPKGEYLWSDTRVIDWINGPVPEVPKPKG